MVWFTCKLCGKKQSRPEEQAGSLVFCTCGQANRVPWESEPGAEEPPQSFPKVWVDENSPRTPAARSFQDPPRRPLDTGRCFNHISTPATQSCSACLLEFCDNCIVKLGDRFLCGPCKNFRVLNTTRPANSSVAAIFSLVLGLIGAPVAACLTTTAGGMGATGVGLSLCALGIVLPKSAILLAARAFWLIKLDPRAGGRSMATIGLMSGIAGSLWSVTVLGILAFRGAGG